MHILFLSAASEADRGVGTCISGGVVGGVVGVVVILTITIVVMVIVMMVLLKSHRGHYSTEMTKRLWCIHI